MKNKFFSCIYSILVIYTVFFTMACNHEVKTKYYSVSYECPFSDITLPDPIRVESGTILTQEQLPELSRAGYEFAGWYDGDVKAVAGEYSVTKSVTLKAEFYVNRYYITYHLNGGEWINPSDYENNKQKFYVISTFDFPKEDELQKEGYGFKGWHKSEDLNDAIVKALAYGTTEDFDLYAEWEKILYTIKYENMEGVEVLSLKDGMAYPSYFAEGGEEITLPDADCLKKAGGEFKGWYLTEDFSGDPVTVLNKDSASESITLYAKWDIATYKITYDLADGEWVDSYTPPSEYLIEDTPVQLPAADKVTRRGYEFAGWLNKEVSSWRCFTEIAEGESGDKTFTADWDAINYSITYMNMEGASFTNSYGNTITPYTTYNIEYTKYLQSPKKTGYTFAGWYLEKEFYTKISVLEDMTGDLVLYAKFIPATREITFYSNYDSTGENGPAYSEIKIVDSSLSDSKSYYEQILYYKQENILLPVNYYSDKWAFTGWNTKADGSGESFTDKALVIWDEENSPSYRYYAQWVKKSDLTYTITLPSASQDDLTLTLNSDGFTLQASKTGFAGNFFWYVNGSSSPVKTESVSSAGSASTFDLKEYFGKENTEYGRYSVMVKVSDGGFDYTQTAIVILKAYKED